MRNWPTAPVKASRFTMAKVSRLSQSQPEPARPSKPMWFAAKITGPGPRNVLGTMHFDPPGKPQAEPHQRPGKPQAPHLRGRQSIGVREIGANPFDHACLQAPGSERMRRSSRSLLPG